MAKARAGRIFLGKTEENDKVFAEIQLNPMYQSHQRKSRTYRQESVNHKIIPFDALTISITHERYTQYGSEVSFGCGTQDFLEVTKPADGLTLADVKRIAELAERWHGNGTIAGCAHQEVIWEKNERYGYRQPSLTLTKPCPITGYKYGHAWLGEVAPTEIIAELDAFIAKGEYVAANDF